MDKSGAYVERTFTSHEARVHTRAKRQRWMGLKTRKIVAPTSKSMRAPITVTKMSDHQVYMRSPEWACRKRDFYRKYGRRCEACGIESFVDLHHLSYKNMGKEPDRDLMALCRVHHEAVHVFARGHRGFSLRQATLRAVEELQAQYTVAADGRSRPRQDT